MASDPLSAGTAGGLYRFRPLTADDFPLLRRWLAEPHVRQWWGEPAHELDLIAGLMAVDWAETCLVEIADGPIAYLQTYDIAAEPGGGWPGLPPGSWGIDTFIGPSEAVGRGHGPAYLRQFGDQLLARPGVERLSVDPDPENARAIHAYERAGFAVERRIATPEGAALLMFRIPDRP